MNRLNRLLIISTFTILLSACGGSEDASDEAAAETVGAPAETEKAYNPLASEQQLIRDAQAIQGILNKDAEKKKKAADEIN
ncbi:MAG: hypothetical protein JKY88_16785 [Pseudomonadales bacterium]|nr:hypothetical protein [Pseudomonadales bacterium]